jgi:hypothetical protein
MHLFARGSYAHAKVRGCAEQVGHVSSRIKDRIIVAIEGFEILIHMLIELGFKILNLARGAAVEFIVNLDGDLFHEFKVALKTIFGQDNHAVDWDLSQESGTLNAPDKQGSFNRRSAPKSR